jgi:superfamily II DNA or RNA helicase
LEYQIKDRTTVFPKLSLTFNGSPREYQKLAINDISKYPIGVLEAKTGAGKTVSGIQMIVIRQQPTLVVVHSKELFNQWRDQIKKFLNYDVGQVGDGKYEVKDITIGIVQTVRNNIDKLRDRFGFVILDECFPSGTMVDNIPIEKIKVGDYVSSFNHEKNMVEKKKVLHVFKSSPKTLCTVKLANGKEIVCTENHPFFTNKGYLTASKLDGSMSVLSIDHHLIGEENGKVSSEELCGMWKASGMQIWKSMEKLFDRGKKQQCEMFQRMCNGAYRRGKGKSWKFLNWIQQRVLFGENEKKQSDEESRNNREIKVCEKDKWYSKCMEWISWREWSFVGTTSPISNCFGMGNGSVSANSKSHSSWKEKGVVLKEGLAHMFQTGYCKQEVKNSSGGGWEKSLYKEYKKERFNEDSVFNMERVESVTIQKRTDTEEFKRMCPDGYVYNIEVEDNSNYFVDGILVHNCHRCPSSTFINVLSQLSCRYQLGLSATPARSDGLGHAIYAFVGPKIHVVSKDTLKEIGAVLTPEIYRVATDFKSFYAGNFQDLVNNLVLDRDRNNLIVQVIQKDLKNHNSVVLVVSDRVAHCNALQKLLERVNVSSIVLTSNITDRESTVDDIRSGKYRVVIATGQLIGEGFSMDSLVSLVLTTPISYAGKLVQIAGRIMRPDEGKTATIYDIRDNHIELLRKQGLKRDKVYSKM